VEYEAARTDLMEEIARGASIQDLRAKLTKKNDSNDERKPSISETKRVPDDLVQIQALYTMGESRENLTIPQMNNL
jgi:alpha-glucan,water dikinase